LRDAGRDGAFRYDTVRPSGYGVPDDGPVGLLFKQAGYSLRRPAHLHFMVSAPGFEPITTHIFDGSDPHLAGDAIFGVKPELVVDFEQAGSAWKAEVIFVMARSKNGARA
jgi:protocatechuate 3,4-dioxygenase beta subunit